MKCAKCGADNASNDVCEKCDCRCSNLEPGKEFYNGRFQIERLGYADSVALAWLAYDKLNNRPCILREYAGTDPAAKRRFRELAHKLAELPEVVVPAVFPFTAESRCWLVEDRVSRTTLADVASKPPPPGERQCSEILSQLLGALNVLHQHQPLFDGNLRPETVVRDDDSVRFMHLACLDAGAPPVDTGIARDIHGAAATIAQLLCGSVSDASAQWQKRISEIEDLPFAATMQWMLADSAKRPASIAAVLALWELVQRAEVARSAQHIDEAKRLFDEAYNLSGVQKISFALGELKAKTAKAPPDAREAEPPEQAPPTPAAPSAPEPLPVPPTPDQPVAPKMSAAPEMPISNGDEDYDRLLDDYSHFEPIAVDKVLQGWVLSVTPKDVIIDFGYKYEGIVPIEQFRNPGGNVTVQQGDLVDVMVDSGGEQPEGYVLLSHTRAVRLRIWENLEKAYQEQLVVSARVLGRVKDGFAVDVGIEAFMPASQADPRTVYNRDSLVGQDIPVKIIKLNRWNLVVSHKAALEDEINVRKSATQGHPVEGPVVTGVVKNLTANGALTVEPSSTPQPTPPTPAAKSSKGRLKWVIIGTAALGGLLYFILGTDSLKRDFDSQMTAGNLATTNGRSAYAIYLEAVQNKGPASNTVQYMNQKALPVLDQRSRDTLQSWYTRGEVGSTSWEELTRIEDWRFRITGSNEAHAAHEYAAGMSAFTQKHYAEAHQLFNTALTYQPNWVLALNAVGRACYNLQNFACAEQYYRRAADTDARWAYPRINLANLYTNNFHNFPAAEAEYREAIGLDGTRGTFHFEYANLLYALGQPRWPEACVEYRAALNGVNSPLQAAQINVARQRVQKVCE